MSALPAGVHRLDAETYHGDKLSPEPAASLAPERFDDCPPRLNVRPGCEGCQEAALVARAALADRIEKERPE
jgi:hypothetical protein